MSSHKLLVALLHLVMLYASSSKKIKSETNCSTSRSNYAPVVGIMAEDSYTDFDMEHGRSHIEASYVKWAEMGGMRVVPVFLNRSEEYYASVYKRVNGLILPGGGVIMGVGDYYNTTKLFLKWSSFDYVNNGNQFPIFGICMGYEVLLYILNGEEECRYNSSGTHGVSLPLNFTAEFSASRLFAEAPDWLINELLSQPITANFHTKSVSMNYYQSSPRLMDSVNVLSTNFDDDEIEFISSVEHRSLPVFGLQWHPEKNQFIYETTNDVIDHSLNSVKVMQYFGNFLSGELKQSCQEYPEDEFLVDQIWNYKLVYSSSDMKLKFYFDW